jgi:hypothetical protein
MGFCSRQDSVRVPELSFVRGGFCHVVTFTFGGAAALAGAAATFNNIPPSIIIAGASGVGAVEVAAHLIKRSDDKAALFDGNPFSYLYQAKKEFGNYH